MYTIRILKIKVSKIIPYFVITFGKSSSSVGSTNKYSWSTSIVCLTAGSLEPLEFSRVFWTDNLFLLNLSRTKLKII